MPGGTLTYSSARAPDSLFEGCSWFYALCREYLFRDHTQEIARALFSSAGPTPGTRVLELGCGPGFYACRLSQEYPQIHTTGIDLSRRLIARAQSRAASRSLRNCSFAHGDAHALRDGSNSIDAVIVSRLFLIIANRAAVLKEVFRVLRPGGRCFIAEPTSGIRTRIPLGCMWLLSKFGGTSGGKYPEPPQADVMTAHDFAALIHSQPWGAVDLQRDGWYQYAVCEKGSAVLETLNRKRTPPTVVQARSKTTSSMSYPALNAANRLASRASQCAFAVMAKAPRAGKVKTRLCPPLTLEQSAAINICFLRDTAENIAVVAASGRVAGIVAYTPIGDEALFDDLLPAGFALLPQRGDGFGERLHTAAEDLLACGYSSVCLIDSDSPTVPTAVFEQAIIELERQGDRIVLGPSHDGGYYLIGLKRVHAELFENISWSTAAVFAETILAANAAGIETVILPLWYDVDDGASLGILTSELVHNIPPSFTTITGYGAEQTRNFLCSLNQQGSVG